MKPKQTHNKKIILAISIALIIVAAIGLKWMLYVQKAHQTFDNYYAFRGCVKLLDKTDDTATCKLKSGQTIKLVKYQGRWFLDGDLPMCQFHICF